MSARLVVLRLGHRRRRDERISTHVGLVARAFGANAIIYSGEEDKNVLTSVKKVVLNWGGPFDVIYVRNWKNMISDWKKEGGIVIHLTMYGINLPDIINDVRCLFAQGKNFLIIVGAEKVPGIVYELADYNIAIGNQPHSEVAALAVFLDWLFEGRELVKNFKGAKIRVVPSQRGKKIIKNDKS